MSNSRNNGSSGVLYRFHHFGIDVLLLVVLIVVIGFFFVGIIGGAFTAIGFSPYTAMFILVGSLLGSWINIPIAKIATKKQVSEPQYVEFFGIVFRVPGIAQVRSPTIIAINLGGAVIPIVISAYLFLKVPQILPMAAISIAIVSIVMFFVARPIKGVGIAAPALVAPLVAATSALLLAPMMNASYVAYVSGVLGTLIGADLGHLKDISKSGPKIAAIGGAGTFDGIFLSGIIAAILA
ncbi:MAG: DUF1614 domain-containing protein [Promethearchaeati archaeon SRVP18_Atabeyarchaeia-1]